MPPLARKFQLQFGPYRPPPVQIGQWVECEIRGEVMVTNWSDGRIAWPRTKTPGGGGRAFVVFGGLARAIEKEAMVAVAYWWTVNLRTAAIWRRALHVPTFNEGTRRLWSYNRLLEAAQRAAPVSLGKLKRQRHQLGLSCQDVSDRMGSPSAGMYGQYELGTRRPSPQMVERLAEALECEVEDLK